MYTNCLLSIVLALWFPFEVISMRSTNYIGTLNHTINGVPCQMWQYDLPHKHDYNNVPENFCRDPSASNYLWCYTMDPQIRWDICDPRALVDVQPFKTILFNTTGTNCLKDVCCNITKDKFRNVESCNPEMLVQLPFFSRLPVNPTNNDLVSFVKRYVVSKYFKFTLSTTARSKLDCAYHCLQKASCNGFTFEPENVDKSCNVGEFISPDALKLMTEISGETQLQTG